MPDLPTLTVSTSQVAVLLAAFEDADGYKTWLKQALRAEVRSRKNNSAISADNVARAVTVDAYMDTALDPEPEPEA